MNLFDMVSRKDEVITVNDKVSLAKVKLSDGELWRCLRMEQHRSTHITVSAITQWYPFSTRPETVGWYARTLKNSATVEVRLVQKDTIMGSTRINIDTTPKAIPIPWPLIQSPLSPELSLTLHFDLAKGQQADLMINRCLERSELTSLAHGNGIEIGPGPRPQIHNSATVSVKYVEEMSAGEWKNLYDKDGQYESDHFDWSNHIVGKASELPCENGSLDFIFSSHVFEHLTNPLGHLSHWASKLKSGGAILAVVPDVAGTKDYRQQPSNLQEMLHEQREDIWEPSEHHYRRWASTRGEWSKRVEEAMAQKRSIHVHFYTRENTATVLNYATAHLGFESFHLRHTPNHRDFYWVLIKK
ncbi:class I SAM-dependent methyltransferase [Pseudomonas sp. Pseu.R1]|uniref:class I SAM-dependent methyltransferase n=1 Tax=Pseudomonas sp. Pseu.R1 TaxID=3379818 RepID=UPI003B949838